MFGLVCLVVFVLIGGMEETPNIDYYKDQIEENIRILESEAFNDDGWKVSKEKEGFTAFLKEDPSTPIKSAKARGILKEHPDLVYPFISGLEEPNIDKHFVKGRDIHKFDEHNEIVYARYNAGVALVADRDFVYFESRKNKENGEKIVICFSIDRKDVPDVPDVVRAHIYYSGWVLRPLNDGTECHATFSAQVDPKGWIPHKLVNFFSGEIAKTMWNIQKFLTSGKVTPAKKTRASKGAPEVDDASAAHEGDDASPKGHNAKKKSK